ncbi:MAG: DMT family transporter [Trueperaceae bacterium]|nr:DMT family transporter [Trueperaceae bacterium]
MPTPSRARVTAVLGVALVAVSLAAIFIRYADAPGVVVALWRMVIAAVVLAPFTLRALARTPLSRQTLKPTLLAGALLGLHFATWISSLSYTTIAASVTLVATIPLWVALFSWLFLGRSPTLTILFGVLVAVAGGAIIAFGDLGGTTASELAPAPLLGNVLATVGAMSAAGYLLLGRSAQARGLGLQAYVGVAYAVAAVVLVPWPAVLDVSYVAYARETFVWIALLALVPQLVGHTGINYAMRHLDPTRVATATLLEPVGAGLMAVWLFREVPGALTLVGAVLVLLGVVMTTRGPGAAAAAPVVARDPPSG